MIKNWKLILLIRILAMSYCIYYSYSKPNPTGIEVFIIVSIYTNVLKRWED